MNIASKIRKKDRISSIFTLADIQVLLDIEDKKSLHNAVFYAVKSGELVRVSEGVFSLDREYPEKEFATKFRTPSYISLYTVLVEAGIVFQPYSSIYTITNRSETVEIDDQKYIYRKIQDAILLNQLGIKQIKGVYTADPERSICDKLYLDGDEHFDNLRNVNWDSIRQLNQQVYFNNKTIEQFINKHSV